MLSPREIDIAWGEVSYFLHRALERSNGERTTDDIKFDCKRGRLCLWVIRKNQQIIGTFTSYVVRHPRFLAFVMDIGGSDPHADIWEQAYRKAGEYARMIGCSRIETTGRVGWARILPRLGFKKDYVTMSASTEGF